MNHGKLLLLTFYHIHRCKSNFQLQSPPAVAPAGEAAHYPADLPSDEPTMIARVQDILVMLSGPQMQLEQTRVGTSAIRTILRC